jgi:hypothetical protein
MSPSRRNSGIVFFSVAALLLTLELGSCSEATRESATIALQVSPGVTLSSAGYWVIAPDGTVTKGTVAVGASSTVLVPISGLPTGSGYQLIVSGLASDGVTGCSGSATFSSPTPSTGVIVHLTCAGPPAAGQLLVTSTLNNCPIIDGVEAIPSAANVGGAMALQATAHDPDSGPAALTYGWSASGGTLNASGAATATFTCTQPGTFNITVAPSDGDATCGVAQTLAVTCTEP